MSSEKTPLKVVYHGTRHALFPTESASVLSNPKVGRWLFLYFASLATVYVTLSIWWTILPSYPFMFGMWMVTVPVGVAIWASENRKGCLMVGLMSGGVAWMCDLFLYGIIESD